MPKVLDNIIVAAVPDTVAHTVALTWANGETTVNSFGHLVGKGVFAAFNDPAFFAQARIGEHGRSLEWPGELDFCADARSFKTHREDAPEQPRRSSNKLARHRRPGSAQRFSDVTKAGQRVGSRSYNVSHSHHGLPLNLYFERGKK